MPGLTFKGKYQADPAPPPYMCPPAARSSLSCWSTHRDEVIRWGRKI